MQLKNFCYMINKIKTHVYISLVYRALLWEREIISGD
jgi:hypothetical protein